VTVLVFAQVKCLAVVVGGCRVHDGLVEHNTYAAAAAATVADDGGRSALLADLLAEVAGCFPRRETRRTCTEKVSGLLSELEDRNCWTLAEAAGHRGPHRFHHFLSRAVWDEELMLDIAASWAAARLDDGDGILIIDETGPASTSCRTRRTSRKTGPSWSSRTPSATGSGSSGTTRS
jgi:hypothetical protein